MSKLSNKFKNVSDELINYALSEAYCIGQFFSDGRYAAHPYSFTPHSENAEMFKKFYQACQPQKYMLFDKIEVEGELPLTEAPEESSLVWRLSTTQENGVEAFAWYDNSDVTHSMLLERGLVWATKEGALAASRVVGWCEEGE